MIRALFVSIFLVIGSSSWLSAELIPLVEFSYEKVPQFGGVSPPPMRDWEFGFSASLSANGNPPLFEWLDVYGMDDVGDSFPAPADVVAGVATALSSPSSSYIMFTAGLSNPAGPGRLSDWNPPTGPCNPCARILVSDPTAHTVMAVERVIDQLIVDNTGFGTWVLGGKQTIRVFGEPIPEAPTLALSAIALGYCMTLLTRQTRSRLVISASRPC